MKGKKMADKKWYRVTAQACTDLYAFVEAESEQDAYEKARWHDEPDEDQFNEFVCGDALGYKLRKSDLIISYYTTQFIRPSDRQILFNKIFSSLKWGGAFILFEKVRARDARFQDMMIGLYNEFKLTNDYSPSEIFNKTRSLKGVMEPFSTKGNCELLDRSGFKDYMQIFKYICFSGFLAIK